LFERLFVPLDGSMLAEAALELAIEIARASGGEIACLYAIDSARAMAPAMTGAYPYDPTPLIDAMKADGENILATARENTASAGVRVTTELCFDSATAAITRAAHDRHSDLIVMGTHGKSGFERAMLGSTAESVLRQSATPVITVHAIPQQCAVAWPFKNVLVALDDSEPADAAAVLALEMAREHGARLTFCTALETGDVLAKAAEYGYDPGPILAEMRAAAEALLERWVDLAHERNLAAEPLVVEGEAVAELIAAAELTAAALILIGSHGRRGLRRFFIGSVAEGVVRTSAQPVLVVRTPHRAHVEHQDRPIENRSLNAAAPG